MWVGTCWSVEWLYLLGNCTAFSTGHCLLIWRNRIGHICKVVYKSKFWGRWNRWISLQRIFTQDRSLPSSYPFSLQLVKCYLLYKHFPLNWMRRTSRPFLHHCAQSPAHKITLPCLFIYLRQPLFLYVELWRVRDGRSFHDYPVQPLPFTKSEMEVIRLTTN